VSKIVAAEQYRTGARQAPSALSRHYERQSVTAVASVRSGATSLDCSDREVFRDPRLPASAPPEAHHGPHRKGSSGVEAEDGTAPPQPVAGQLDTVVKVSVAGESRQDGSPAVHPGPVVERGHGVAGAVKADESDDDGDDDSDQPHPRSHAFTVRPGHTPIL